MAGYQQVPWPYSPFHGAFGHVVRTYVCPNDTRVSLPRLPAHFDRPAGLTSYVGVSGLDYTQNSGVLFLDSALPLAEITDGTSNTLAVGERPPSTDFMYGWWYTGAGQDGSGNVDMVLGMNERASPDGIRAELRGCDTGAAYSYGPGDLEEYCHLLHFWSLHPGGAHFLSCDGSVSLIAYEVDQALMNSLATRSGREVLELEP